MFKKSVLMTLGLFGFVQAASADPLPIAIYWQPPPGETSNARYAEIAACNVNTIFATNGMSTPGDNIPALNAAQANGLKYIIKDDRIYGAAPSDQTIAQVVSDYAAYGAKVGYNIRDEPAGDQLPQFASTYSRLRAADSTHALNYVNLYPTYAYPGNFIVPRLATVEQLSTGNGDFATTTKQLGQSFKTGATQTGIKKIQLYIDPGTWSEGEALTLSLYDSTKSTRLGSSTLSRSGPVSHYPNAAVNEYYPLFTLDVAVTPNTTYYWELSHAYGGDGSVGWVGASSSDVYPDGTAFINNTPQSFDWYFKVYDRLSGETHVAQNVDGDGETVTSTQSVGQTFMVPSSTSYPLHYVELRIDPTGWSDTEALRLTVYQSAQQRTELARAVLKGTNNGGYPRFYLNARLTAGQTYYMELTHDGGGNGAQGWVTRSTAPTSYVNGAGYVNGTLQSWDLRFRQVYGLGWYEEYVDAWLDLAAPSALMFDHYPFKDGSDSNEYFWNLKIIQDRARAHNKPFWAFLQTATFTGSRTPTSYELHWNAYTSLAMGAKGLAYFLYWTPEFFPPPSEEFRYGLIAYDGSRTALYGAAAFLNSQLKQLGPTLMDLTHEAVYRHGPVAPVGISPVPDAFFFKPTNSAQPLLVSHFTTSTGRKAVLVVNMDYRQAIPKATFELPSNPWTLYEVSKSTGLEVTVPLYAKGTGSSAGQLTVAIGPGDGRLFLLPAGY